MQKNVFKSWRYIFFKNWVVCRFPQNYIAFQTVCTVCEIADFGSIIKCEGAFFACLFKVLIDRRRKMLYYKRKYGKCLRGLFTKKDARVASPGRQKSLSLCRASFEWFDMKYGKWVGCCLPIFHICNHDPYQWVKFFFNKAIRNRGNNNSYYTTLLPYLSNPPNMSCSKYVHLLIWKWRKNNAPFWGGKIIWFRLLYTLDLITVHSA